MIKVDFKKAFEDWFRFVLLGDYSAKGGLTTINTEKTTQQYCDTRSPLYVLRHTKETAHILAEMSRLDFKGGWIYLFMIEDEYEYTPIGQKIFVCSNNILIKDESDAVLFKALFPDFETFSRDQARWVYEQTNEGRIFKKVEDTTCGFLGGTDARECYR